MKQLTSCAKFQFLQLASQVGPCFDESSTTIYITQHNTKNLYSTFDCHD